MCEHMLSPYQNMYRTLRSLWVHLHVCFNLVTTTTSANLFSLNLIFPQCYLHFGLWCPFMSVWIYNWNNLEEKQKSINLLKRSLCEQWAWNNHIYSSWLTVWSLVYFLDMKNFTHSLRSNIGSQISLFRYCIDISRRLWEIPFIIPNDLQLFYGQWWFNSIYR